VHFAFPDRLQPSGGGEQFLSGDRACEEARLVFVMLLDVLLCGRITGCQLPRGITIKVATTLALANGGVPASIVYRIAPTAHTSTLVEYPPLQTQSKL